MLFVVNVEALRAECAVTIAMSIPHMPKKNFTKKIGYSYDKLSYCGVPSRFSLKRSMCDLYSLRQLIILSFPLDSND